MRVRFALKRIAAVYAVAALNAGGLCAFDLDPTFGQDGKVMTPFPGQQAGADAVLIQPDGRIVAAGFVGGSSSRRVALARYNFDGSLDATFGAGGVVVTDAGGVESYATAIAIQPDGKILLAGVVVVAGNDSSFLVIRYLADGTLDPSFGLGGIVTTDFLAGPGGSDGARALALEPAGRIVAAGNAGTFFTGTTTFALARYEPDGTLDPTFGVGGRVVVDMGVELYDAINAMVAGPNGAVVACGQAFEFPNYRLALIRLGPDGSLDPAFGAGGRVYTLDAGCLGMRLQPNGRIVAFGGVPAPPPIYGDIAVLRYLEDGSLDPDFGAGGIASTRFEGGSGASAGAIMADGRLVAAGYAFDSVEIDFALAGYRADGQPDLGFGPMGRLTTDFDGGHDAVKAMAIQPDGRLVAAGFAGPVAQTQFALARYAEATIMPVPGLSRTGLLALGALLALAGTFALARPGSAV